MNCTQMAADVCNRADGCSSISPTTRASATDVVTIVYESIAYCEMVFEKACGPDVPANYNPRVPDPASCGGEIGASRCLGGALILPKDCGGS